MTTFTYRKVSYLNDPYQQYLLSKAKSEIKPNVKTYNAKNVKKEHRTTKLLLDVNEYGIFSNLDEFGNNSNGLTPRSINLNKNLESGNGSTSHTDIENKQSFSNIKNGMLSPTSNTIKHTSFMNPLKNMNFNVGGMFENDKDAGDIFSSILSKVNSDNENKYIDNEPIAESEDYNKRIRNLRLANRLSQLSQDTVKMKHYSSPTDDRSFSFVGSSVITEKRKGSLRANTITEKYSSSYKDDNSLVASRTITEKPRSLAARKVNSGISNTDKLDKQNTVKGSTKMIGSFNNHLIENLNEQPTIFEGENFFNNNGENNEVIADFYMDDDKIDQSFTLDWFDQYKDEENKEHSMKSSRSKYSNFTLSSTKKLTKKAKKFYKKIIKQKQEIPIPLNPLEIPDSYNEKERAFEEMIFRDDTINLTLSNTLTSTFADNNFPLTEDIEENNNEEEVIRDPENSFVSSVVSSSVVSSVSNYEDGTLRKRRHRKAINFEEALKDGNEFRRSLANL